jgi:hypothetical protein
MKNMITLSLVLALALGPFVVIASGSPSANPHGAPPPKAPPAPKSGATTPASASPSAAVSGDYMGRHTMTGEVTKIDSAKGTFSLKTAEAGTLDLHAPPSALADVKEGDRMSVEIAVKPLR